MKKSIFKIQMISFLLAILSQSSCENWDLIGMKGKGPIVSKSIEMIEVEGIILDIPATVYLSQGDVQSISMEGQENILDNINHFENNGVLELKFDQPVAKAEPVVIYMTVKSLKEVSMSGSGSILSQSVLNVSDQLKITISGSGDINLEANAQSVTMDISGSGSIILNSVCENIYAEIKGSGDIYLNGGHAKMANYSISGSGNIDAFPFIAESCYVKTNGSGDAKVNVKNYLDVYINGSGNVYYQGNPDISIKVNGSGDVIHTK